MREFLTEHKELWWWLGGVSAATAIATLALIPIIVVRMGSDYFLECRDEESTLAGRRPLLRWCGLILKNALGLLLVIAGLAMLVLPGQGLMTILIGIMVTNFPGKRALERRLIRIEGIHRAINRLRARFDRPPLHLPPHPQPLTPRLGRR